MRLKELGACYIDDDECIGSSSLKDTDSGGGGMSGQPDSGGGQEDCPVGTSFDGKTCVSTAYKGLPAG